VPLRGPPPIAIERGGREEDAVIELANIDLTSKTVIVEATVYKGRLVRPKTAAGRRRVDLSQRALRVLQEQLLARQPNEGGYVFPASGGGVWDANNLRHRVLAPAARRAGLVGVTFHDLWHTYAALMVKAGAHPKYLQAQMGHSTIKTTLDTYGHLFPDANRTVLDALDDITAESTIPDPTTTPSLKRSQPRVGQKIPCFQDFLYRAYRDRTGDLRLAKPRRRSRRPTTIDEEGR
jgi:integrase-like protein